MHDIHIGMQAIESIIYHRALVFVAMCIEPAREPIQPIADVRGVVEFSEDRYVANQIREVSDTFVASCVEHAKFQLAQSP